MNHPLLQNGSRAHLRVVHKTENITGEMLKRWLPHLPGYVSGEVAVRCKLQVAAVSSSVIHHVYLPRLARDEKKKERNGCEDMWKKVELEPSKGVSHLVDP